MAKPTQARPQGRLGLTSEMRSGSYQQRVGAKGAKVKAVLKSATANPSRSTGRSKR